MPPAPAAPAFAPGAPRYSVDQANRTLPYVRRVVEDLVREHGRWRRCLAALDADRRGVARPADADALVTELDGGSSEEAGAADLPVTGLRPPWPVGAEARPAEAIVACDGRGVLAALAYAPADDGVPVPDLDLALGRDAVPVRRGVPRVAPGTLLPAAAPIAILLRGRFAAAVALEGLASLDNGTVTALAHRLVLERGWETTLPAQLGEASEQAKARLARAVVRDGRDARTLEVASSARQD